MKKNFLLMIFMAFISFSSQIDKTFPVSAEDFDDSILTNQIFEFKAFKDQGYIVLNYENLKKVDIYVNAHLIDTSSLKGTGQKKIYIGKYTNNDKNILSISNLDGKVNIKIPYPIVLEKGDKEYNKTEIKYIDKFLKSEIKAGFPSIQIAVIKNGKLEFAKSYGSSTNETMYDIASNTKMYATNYAIQKLVYEKKLNLDTYIKDIFPDFVGKNKEKVQVSDLLKHQAGFPADPQYHNDLYDKDDGIKNGKNDLYAIGKENVLKAIMKTPLEYEPKTKTKYSDVDYMLLGLIVEKITGKNLDEYVNEEFYSKLNLKHTMFNPLQHGISKNNIAPTELHGNTRDGLIEFKNIRKNVIWGEVHDEKAYYAMKGVSGHAGLFSNAIELAKLAQIMINQGGYGENKFFDKTTVDIFTEPNHINTSYGLGWRRQGDNIYSWAFSGIVGKDTIGHTGWTGTVTVIDPNQNLVVVLLTNAKHSKVIDNKKNPNKFFADQFYTKKYGAIITLLVDAFTTKDNKDTKRRIKSYFMDLSKQETPNKYIKDLIK
ncbi:penicillin binding protein PBP4B [Sneathia sanguinegens]|uniref:penicillin binding protein PBP4B n=1 Tax=Sneathia sanguinegens TaxID=40543 RepID=UPI00258C242F|nr:penicillin binding protein PBP4B [Sneathia sanguinegens]MDU4652014.1 penicillin binding protein PBP4B [Sneathia sanguinegens]MDU7496363.1 penicillin binding protein PBP4B [Sneathia sanguinegens]